MLLNTVSHTGLVDGHAYTVTGVTTVTRARYLSTCTVRPGCVCVCLCETRVQVFCPPGESFWVWSEAGEADEPLGPAGMERKVERRVRPPVTPDGWLCERLSVFSTSSSVPRSSEWNRLSAEDRKKCNKKDDGEFW